MTQITVNTIATIAPNQLNPARVTPSGKKCSASPLRGMRTFMEKMPVTVWSGRMVTVTVDRTRIFLEMRRRVMLYDQRTCERYAGWQWARMYS